MSARILIVEDDALLAIDMAHLLETAGFVVVGPATSVRAALDLVRGPGCDAGVLDVHLGRETSEPVAVELMARGTPFVTVTGYSTRQRPPGFADAPLLSKPVRSEALITLLRNVLAAS